ncbi:HAD family hydrolase [Actinomyces wuliandei]|uniref:HAD family hydrolase n=1 Tax=Actinomyces wuliandei TaxID=2057743 RepID=UPI000FD95235|nr:HAD family hydrolase [Actinomyces wuliandei]
MTRLLVTDLDATIVFDRQVGAADRAAMERWRQAGNLLVVDTGKSVVATRDVLEPCGVGFDYGVVFTGAVLVDGGYQVLSARFIPDGVAHEVVSTFTQWPGVTVFATTIEADHILAQGGGTSSVLPVYSPMTLQEMAAHQFIGVPMRVPDDTRREAVRAEVARRWGGVLECHRNQDFLDLVPAGSSKGSGLRQVLSGPLAGRDLEVWTIGDSWNDLDMHAQADHAVALPWSPPEVAQVCERSVASMAELIDSLLAEEA